MGLLAVHCYKYLIDFTEPVAVKVFSMTILANIAKVFPELKGEIISIIDSQLPYSSAAFKTRGNKVIRSLNKL